MERILLSLSFFLASVFAVPAFANTSAPSAAEAYSPAAQHSLPGNLTQDELLNLKPKEIAARSGQKLSFFQRMALRMVQKKLKKQKARQQKKGLKGEPTPAGKASLWMGITSLAAISLGILSAISGLFHYAGLFAFIFLVSGIIAFSFGRQAKRNGDRSFAAKTGFILGLFAIGILSASLIFLAILGIGLATY